MLSTNKFVEKSTNFYIKIRFLLFLALFSVSSYCETNDYSLRVSVSPSISNLSVDYKNPLPNVVDVSSKMKVYGTVIDISYLKYLSNDYYLDLKGSALFNLNQKIVTGANSFNYSRGLVKIYGGKVLKISDDYLIRLGTGLSFRRENFTVRGDSGFVNVFKSNSFISTPIPIKFSFVKAFSNGDNADFNIDVYGKTELDIDANYNFKNGMSTGLLLSLTSIKSGFASSRNRTYGVKFSYNF